jgi:phage terminase large subunit
MLTEAHAKYREAALKSGCPIDQFRNFMAAGLVLEPKQLAFAALARECDREGGPTAIALGGARMGGKSHAILSQMGADDCIRHPGLKCLMLRKSGGSAKESFEGLLPRTIGRLGKYVPSDAIFRFANGSWIKLGHFQNESDVDKYLGLEYDVIAIEEATTLSTRKTQAIVSCNRSPKGSGWRARTYRSTNPGGVGHAHFKAEFVEPCRKGTPTASRFIPATVDDNPHCAIEYRTFLDGLTGWLKRAWRYGDWDIAAGQFFTTWDRDSIVIRPTALPAHLRVWLGLDYGFTHYTCVYLMAEDGDGNVYAMGEHAERRWLVERHCKAIDAMIARYGVGRERLQRFVAGADVFSKRPTGGTVADDYKTHGYFLTAANDDRIAGAASILRRLGDVTVDPPIMPTLFISEHCPRLIECLPSLEHDPHRPEDVLKVDTDENGLGGDDPYDAFRYAMMVAERPKVGSPASSARSTLRPFRGYPNY